MPIVRNGRGEKAVYEVGLAGEPPGPVERRQATTAERAAWAAAPTPSPLERHSRAFNTSEAERRTAAHRGGEANRQRRLTEAQHAAFGVGNDPQPPTPLITVIDPPVMPQAEPEEETVMSAPASESSLPVVPGLELVAPCPSCLHEPVCGIRAQLDPEAFRVFTVEELDAALSLRPRIDVDCSHFLPGPAPAIVEEARRLSPVDRLEAIDAGDDVDESPSDPEYSGSGPALGVVGDGTPYQLPEPKTNGATRMAEFAGQRASEHAKGGAGRHTRRTRLENGLTIREDEILTAAVRHGGSLTAAANELRISRAQVDVTLERIGKRGLLPAELIPKLPARFAKYSGVQA